MSHPLNNTQYDPILTILEDSGYLPLVFTAKYDTEYPAIVRYEIEGNDFTVDCSQVKDVWDDGMEEDLRAAIDRKFKTHFFLSHKDLNLNIVL